MRSRALLLLALSAACASACAADAQSIVRLVNEVELPVIRDKFNPLIARSRARGLLRHVGEERGFSREWNVDTPAWKKAEAALVSVMLEPGRRLPGSPSLPRCLEELEPTGLAALSETLRSEEWHAAWRDFDARGWLFFPFNLNAPPGTQLDPSLQKEYEEISKQSPGHQTVPAVSFQTLRSNAPPSTKWCVGAAIEHVLWRHAPPFVPQDARNLVSPILASFEKRDELGPARRD